MKSLGEMTLDELLSLRRRTSPGYYRSRISGEINRRSNEIPATDNPKLRRRVVQSEHFLGWPAEQRLAVRQYYKTGDPTLLEGTPFEQTRARIIAGDR